MADFYLVPRSTVYVIMYNLYMYLDEHDTVFYFLLYQESIGELACWLNL